MADPAAAISTTLGIVLSALAKSIAWQAWQADYAARGAKVAQARKYQDGDHDAALTQERLKLLNLSMGTKSAFTANYCDTVLQTMVERIELETIEADNAAATKWAQEVLEANDIEELQLDLHEACIRDGDAFLLVSSVGGVVTLNLEPAWDGTSGMLVYYDHTGGRRVLKVAVKVWSEMSVLRFNAYFPDHVEKWSNEGGKGMVMIDTLPWLDRMGQPLGVPVVHFTNKAQATDDYGLSELENVIPLQDALNRTIHSMIANSEYNAFNLRYSIGLPAPGSYSPGSWFEWTAKNQDGKAQFGVSADKKYEVGTLPAGDLAPFIDQCKFLIQQIGFISRTPSPEMMGGDNSSGESLKQREIGLLGKVKRFQTKSTSAWRNVMILAHKIQSTFGAEPSAYKGFYPRWASAELRNDAQLIANAKAMRDDLPLKEYYKLVAPVWGWDEKYIDSLVEQKEAEANANVARYSNVLPNFENVSISPNGGNENG